MEEWVELRDQSGHPYYWNKKTSQTTWTPPDALKNQQQQRHQLTTPPPSNERTAMSYDSLALPPGWKSALDQEGRTYYYNRELGKSQYEYPTSTPIPKPEPKKKHTPRPPPGRKTSNASNSKYDDYFDGRSVDSNGSIDHSYDMIEVRIEKDGGPLGITLVHEAEQEAIIKDVTYGELAHKKGIFMGDVLYKIKFETKVYQSKHTAPWIMQDVIKKRPILLFLKRFPNRAIEPFEEAASANNNNNNNNSQKSKVSKDELLRELNVLKQQAKEEEEEIEKLRQHLQSMQGNKRNTLITQSPDDSNSSLLSDASDKPKSLLKKNSRFGGSSTSKPALSPEEERLQAIAEWERKRAMQENNISYG